MINLARYEARSLIHGEDAEERSFFGFKLKRG